MTRRWVWMLLATGLSGCATFHQTDHMEHVAKSGIARAQQRFPKVVRTTAAPYLLGRAVEVAPAQSPVLRETVTLVTVRSLSIGAVAGRIADMTGIAVRVTGLSAPGGGLSSIPALPAARMHGGLPPPPAALFAAASRGHAVRVGALRYHGTLRGLLDTVTAQTGLSWRFRHGEIVLFRVESRTFAIPALPWSTRTHSKIEASAGATSSSGALGMGGAGGGGGGGGGTASSTGSTSIQNSSETDVWKGLEKTADAVSDGAHVVADASSGTITVTGTPDQVGQVAEWVHSLRRTLSKQVAVTIRVYNVQIQHEQNYGFSPTLAFQNAAKSFGLSLGGAQVPAVVSSTTPLTFAASILNTATGAAGEFAGTQAAVQALATLGRVSQVFTRSIVTLNGQPAPIQVAQQTGYLAESETSQAANVGSTTGLIPGTVTSGFTGTFLPRVVGNRILLGMNITISTLVGLKTVTSGGASIQVPTTTDTVIQQSAALRSGSTLMITGYREADGNATHNGVGSPFFALLGGGGDATAKRQMIAIVVSARTL